MVLNKMIGMITNPSKVFQDSFKEPFKDTMTFFVVTLFIQLFTSVLLNLEFEGIVACMPGKIFRIV